MWSPTVRVASDSSIGPPLEPFRRQSNHPTRGRTQPRPPHSVGFVRHSADVPTRHGVTALTRDRRGAGRPDLLDRLLRRRAGADARSPTSSGCRPAPGSPVDVARLGARRAARRPSAAAASPAPWQHQAEAADLAWSGRHVVVATGTASGKSLAYQLPALTAAARRPAGHRALPGADQGARRRPVARRRRLDLPGVRPACYDGDTPRAEREWVRQHSRFVLTNPDMLHHGILPGHAAWAPLPAPARVRGRRRVPHLPRRVRLARGARAAPAAPAPRPATARHRSSCSPRRPPATRPTAAARLTGLPVTAVTEDASPRGGVTFALWEPPLLPPDPALRPVPAQPTGDARRAAPVRRSALRETADLLADAVVGRRAHARVRPVPPRRRGGRRRSPAARWTRRSRPGRPGRRLPGRLPAARSGGRWNGRCSTGELLGLASTNALELGVDLVGLDAVLICGYPGHPGVAVAAGRPRRPVRAATALRVLVARDDPLDTYLVHHPEALFGRPVEATVLDPANPYVLGPQLCLRGGRSAAHPGRPGRSSAPARRRPVLDALVAAGRAAPPPDRLVLDRTSTAPTSTCAAPAARRSASSSRRPAGCSARSTRGSSHVAASTRARSTCTRACPTWSTRLDLDDGCALVHAERAGLVHPRPRRHRPVRRVGALLRRRRAGRRSSSARWT